MRILVFYTGELGKKVIQNLSTRAVSACPVEIYATTAGKPESHMQT